MQLAGLTEALREAPLAGTCLKTGLAMHYALIVVEKTRKKWGLKCTATSALITLLIGASLLYLIKECPKQSSLYHKYPKGNKLR